MKLEELRTGDMIIMRNADMGMVQIRDPEIYLLYLDTGFGYSPGRCVPTYPILRTRNLREIAAEDLKGIQDDREHDIMQVFRREKGMIDFNTFEEGEMVYDRDRSWIRPPVDLYDKSIFRKFIKQITELEEGQEKGGIIFADHTWDYDISAAVSGDPEKVMSDRFIDSQVIVQKIRDHLEYISIPGTEDLYIVFSAFFEERAKKHMDREREKPLAVFPEINLEIWSPCFACRRSADGEFGSLTAEDAPILFKYMTCRNLY